MENNPVEMETVYVVGRTIGGQVLYLVGENPLWGDRADALMWRVKGRAGIAAWRHSGFVAETRVPA